MADEQAQALTKCHFTIQTYFCIHRSWQRDPRVAHILPCVSTSTDGKEKCTNMALVPAETEIKMMCKQCKLARERKPRPYGSGFAEETQYREDVEAGKEDEEWVEGEGEGEGDEEKWPGLQWEWEFVREGDGKWGMRLCERGLVRVGGAQTFEEDEHGTGAELEGEMGYEADVEPEVEEAEAETEENEYEVEEEGEE